MIIAVKKTLKTYCHQCGEARKCSEIALNQWDYSFLLCEKCLMLLSEQASNGMEAVKEK
jgi:hypothetical protein